MEYFSSTQSNKSVSLAEMWMNLETTIQSEISQKEKNRYCTILVIYGIYKNVPDELICKAEREKKK